MPEARGQERGTEPKQLLLSGFFNRIFIEVMTPEYWLSLLGKTVDSAAKSPQEGTRSKAK